MPAYRAYVLDKDDHILARHELEAENHSAAMKTAEQYVNGHDVEVWLRTHVVGRVKGAVKRSTSLVATAVIGRLG